MRKAWVFVAVLAACESKPEPEAAQPQTTAPVQPADSLLPDEPAYVFGVNLDSLRLALDSMERALSKAPEARQPELLLELGRAKKRYLPMGGTPEAKYATEREAEYWYNEIGGSYLYTGYHFQQLIERFPNHRLADDAAYQLTMLPQGGECEGFMTCYVARALHDVDDFMKNFPNSPYAERALERGLQAFAPLDTLDLTRTTEMYDPNELPAILARFDTMTARLPPALRTRAEILINSINARLGKK